MRFHRAAFVALLEKDLQLHGEKPSHWAQRAGISPGTLHDITSVRPGDEQPRRAPSNVVIKKLADALNVPVAALLANPERVAS